MSLTSLPTLNRLTLREQVLAALREGIVTGQLRPGDHLGETELAAAYQVSRGTVREALRFLQQAGLVTGDARGKLRVWTPMPREITELYDVRAALEALAVRAIIASGERKEVATQLRRVLPPETDAQPTYAERLNLDLKFHEAICRFSGNNILLEQWKQLEDRMRIIMFDRESQAGTVQLMGAARHAAIVDLIESGREGEAQRALFEHMEQAARLWARQVS